MWTSRGDGVAFNSQDGNLEIGSLLRGDITNLISPEKVLSAFNHIAEDIHIIPNESEVLHCRSILTFSDEVQKLVYRPDLYFTVKKVEDIFFKGFIDVKLNHAPGGDLLLSSEESQVAVEYMYLPVPAIRADISDSNAVLVEHLLLIHPYRSDTQNKLILSLWPISVNALVVPMGSFLDLNSRGLHVDAINSDYAYQAQFGSYKTFPDAFQVQLEEARNIAPKNALMEAFPNFRLSS